MDMNIESSYMDVLTYGFNNWLVIVYTGVTVTLLSSTSICNPLHLHLPSHIAHRFHIHVLKIVHCEIQPTFVLCDRL